MVDGPALTPALAGGRWLPARAQATPLAPALFFEDRAYTYADLERHVARLAAALEAAGVAPGARLAALLPNSPAYAFLVHAAARIGAVLVPLNTRLTADELHWQYDLVARPWLVVDDATMDRAAPFADDGRLLGLRPTGELQPAVRATHPETLPLDPAVQAIVFTSGTSGRPKGALITYQNHFYSAFASAARIGLYPDDLWLSPLPLYHVGGLAVLWRSCLYGTAFDLHPRFDATAIDRRLDLLPVTLISLVPTMLRRLLGVLDSWPPTLRLILLGGATAEPELVAAANAMADRAIVAPTYGLTEAASQVATATPDEAVSYPGTVGRPLIFTTVRLVDEAGGELPPGQAGELLITGPTVSPGYFETGQIERPLSAAGGYGIATGDIGRRDENGRLTILQRRSDLIVTGGENVYPAEVEAVLRRHPAVRDVAVVGIPDPEWGQRVAALVVADGVTEEQLLAFARQSLAGYKIPRLLRIAAALPLTASGKVARAAIAEQLAADATS